MVNVVCWTLSVGHLSVFHVTGRAWKLVVGPSAVVTEERTSRRANWNELLVDVASSSMQVILAAVSPVSTSSLDFTSTSTRPIPIRSTAWKIIFEVLWNCRVLKTTESIFIQMSEIFKFMDEDTSSCCFLIIGLYALENSNIIMAIQNMATKHDSFTTLSQNNPGDWVGITIIHWLHYARICVFRISLYSFKLSVNFFYVKNWSVCFDV